MENSADRNLGRRIGNSPMEDSLILDGVCRALGEMSEQGAVDLRVFNRVFRESMGQIGLVRMSEISTQSGVDLVQVTEIAGKLVQPDYQLFRFFDEETKRKGI